MKKLVYLLYPSIPLVVFIIWTILVKTIDVHYIENIGFLGFFDFNLNFNNFVVTLNTSLFSKLSDVLLILSLATIVPFAVLGVIQLVKRKSLLKVDSILYFMLAGYVLAVFLYVVLDIAKINFSPTSTPEKLKPSYPSSHVFATIAFLSINTLGLFHYVKMRNSLSLCVFIGLILLCSAQIVFRAFSGEHYLTDIIGGVILSIFVFNFVYCIYNLYLEKSEENNEENNN